MRAKAKNVTQVLNDTKMSEQQKNYALAKAEKETKKERADQATQKLREKEKNLLENYEGTEKEEEKLDKVNEKIVEKEKEVGYLKATEKLREAEKNLVTWAFNKLDERVDLSARLENLEELKENWNKNPRIKDKVINTAFKYNPNK